MKVSCFIILTALHALQNKCQNLPLFRLISHDGMIYLAFMTLGHDLCRMVSRPW